ncbi:MAG: RNA pseudouridine synthase [Sneathiella sp.]|nr:RNA pseudouridine synthase [Sneathiella sp.]
MPYNPPPESAAELLYQDGWLLAFVKASGLLSVPGREAHLKDCAEHRAKKIDRNARIVHRLDMDTSGLLLFGKGAEAHRRLSRMFADREVEKRYIARVLGEVSEETGEITLPLAADWPNRPLQKVDEENGKPARTRWERIAVTDGTSLLALYPETGRTHQLRLHLAAIGHPILGDRFYGTEAARAAASRLQLHAERLSFAHPETGEPITLTAASPF